MNQNQDVGGINQSIDSDEKENWSKDYNAHDHARTRPVVEYNIFFFAKNNNCLRLVVGDRGYGFT
jgi:hypothetical protein